MTVSIDQAAVRGLAAKAFNEAWELIERTDRTPEDDARMLVAATASRYLWGLVGGAEQAAVGDWQIAHVASLMGDPGLARMFAVSSLATVEANGWTDWRLASALEGMARAAAVAGEARERETYAARCRAALETVEKDDRELIASQLQTVPGLGTATSPDLEPLSFLLGHWRGSGRGLWDGDFTFGNYVRFSSDGRPLIEFSSSTTHDGSPSHGEVGYLMARGNGEVTMTLAEPSGITETLTGTVSGERVELTSVDIGHGPGSSDVTATSRRFFLDDGRLVFETDIALDGAGAAPHTRSVLERSVH